MVSPAVLGAARPRVLVIGAGAGGASVARALARRGDIAVTLVERRVPYVTCVRSNAVLAGLEPPASIEFDLGGLATAGVRIEVAEVLALDAHARRARLADGRSIGWDRAVAAPGIEFVTDAIEGYGPDAAERMPAAYLDGREAVALGARIRAMPERGTFLLVAPPVPYRCPPAPYERVSLVAHFLRRHKPGARIVILDYKDGFLEQDLFQRGWSRFYEGMIEWLPAVFTGGITGVDPAAMAVLTGDERFTADVVSFIPPQRAARLARDSGLAGDDGWCAVDPSTLESHAAPGVHVLGDAVGIPGMPKSAYAAHGQAAVCAAAVRASLGLGAPVDARFVSTCWSLIAPDHAVRTGETLRAAGGRLKPVAKFGSTLEESDADRARTAREAARWFDTAVRAPYR